MMNSIRKSIINLVLLILLLVVTSTAASAAPGDVTITNPEPNNKNTTYNPRLSVLIQDINDNDLIVTFETNITGTWQAIDATQEGKSGTHYQRTYDMMAKGQRYYWRVSVFDGTDTTTSDIYSFLAQGAFIFKWSYNNGGNTNNGPVAVDVNNDGIYEVFASGQGRVSCINGLTGQEIWRYTNARFSEHSPIEIADLDNDGTYELVLPASDRTIALNAEDGTVFWDVAVPSANKYPLILDTDGNHYPYIYVSDSDHFYGTAKLSKLRGTDGAIMAQQSVWYPCFSGLSAADADNDGRFEIYMCDRKTGYEGPNGLGKGMQAYDAEDLSLLWYDGNLTCSSHLVALVDVNDDGVLDSIALPQSGSSGGIYVIDGSTGAKMPDKWANNLGLGTHSPPSIYDIDLDGNLELVTSKDGPMKIWDLNTWTLDAEIAEFNFSEPARFADVVGDEKLEIIGTQTVCIACNQSGAFRIYDWQYNLIESETSLSPIAATIVQDIDNDDQNELIGIEFNGLVKVYETSAYAPTPRVRTNNQLYGLNRLGAGVYVPPPGAPQPIIKSTYPVDDAINVPLSPTLSARIVDYHYDKLDVEIAISNSPSGPWNTVKTWTGADNGDFTYDAVEFSEYDTAYYWRVTASDPDGDDMTTTQVFSFISTPQSPWLHKGWTHWKEITIDHAKVAGDLTDFPVLIEFTDPAMIGISQDDADDFVFTSSDTSTKLSHEVESYDPATGQLVAWVKIPLLSSTEDTRIYVYFGNPEAESQETPEDVWDSNFLAVHHLEETEGDAILDSTAINNDGTAMNGLLLDVQGKINGAGQFDGVDDRIILPQVLTDQTQFTFESWVSITDNSKTGNVITQRDLEQKGALIQYLNTGEIQFYINDKQLKRAAGGSYIWHRVVGTYDGTTARLYVDDNMPSAIATTITWPALPTTIGDRAASDRPFPGMIDEVRISKVARSEAYIRTSYSNQNDPAGFITASEIMTEEPLPQPVIWNEYPAHLSTKVPFSLSQLSFELLNGDDTMDYTVTTSPNIGSANVRRVAAGIMTVPVSNVQPNTYYTWTIEANNGRESTRREFRFTTAKSFTLDLSTSGNGNIIVDKPAPYPGGSEITITAIPGQGWEFIGWSGGRLGIISGTENPITITLNDNTVLRAYFKETGRPLLADSTFDASINSADLRANATYQDWWESRNNTWTDPETNITYYGRELLTLDESDVGGNTGKKAKLSESLLFNDTYRLNSYMTQELKSPTPNLLSIQYDIYVDTILDNPLYPDTDRAAHQMIGIDSGRSSGPNSAASDRFVFMGFYHQDGSTTPGDSMSLIAPGIDSSATNSTDWQVIADDLVMDQWYTIRLDLNIPARNYDVYIDGELRAAGVPAYGTLLSYVSHISFATWNDGVGTFYVDNVQEVVPPCIDNDGDGYGLNCALGPDCDDNDFNINPGADDSNCNGIDENCNFIPDDGYVPTDTTCGIEPCASTGELQCISGEIINTCVPLCGSYCGDNVTDTELGEECDGLEGLPEHYTCSFNCTLVYVPYCGDGNIDEGEECDGSDFGGKTCSSFDHNRGTLSCTDQCTIDSSDCYTRRSSGGGGGGGGGGSTSTSDDWICDEWSECIDGVQTQSCTSGTTIVVRRTNTRNCTVEPDNQASVTLGIDGTEEIEEATGAEATLTGEPGAEEENAEALTEDSEITGAVIGSSANERPVWALALMISSAIMAVIVFSARNRELAEPKPDKKPSAIIHQIKTAEPKAAAAKPKPAKDVNVAKAQGEARPAKGSDEVRIIKG